jgi:hypothetical protein
MDARGDSPNYIKVKHLTKPLTFKGDSGEHPPNILGRKARACFTNILCNKFGKKIGSNPLN